MWDAYEATFPYRLAFGVAFFLVLGVADRIRHPENPRRAKEYLFLAFSVAAAVLYGLAHDHVTATISPRYFLVGKGLAGDPRPFRLAVSILAVRGTYWVGLLGGAALLIANNPSAQRPQLPYRALVRLVLLALGTSLAAAGVGALMVGLDAFDMMNTASEFVGAAAARGFLIVLGCHAGSYAGGAVGIIAALVIVRHRRRSLAAAPAAGAPGARSASVRG